MLEVTLLHLLPRLLLSTLTPHSCVTLQAEFFGDMDALGVRRPDVLTRVVEYLPEIIQYVQVGDVLIADITVITVTRAC